MRPKLLREAIIAFTLVFFPAHGGGIITPAFSAEKRAELVQYSVDTDLKALAAKGKTVVFFFATWCPNCILTLTELQEKWNEIDPDLTLVIADYDRETALKAEYGVTYQDSFVLLDRDAKSVRLWNAGGVKGLNENSRAQ
ncbi:TlpA family protein disulfide reductase [Falsochrobactrum shanghaiense]|uniref:TlpA family protein disulfide reductase n=1 Tax=Falsochrobactrum shanghaiense TaxID=2201899 RepID=UPI001304C40B|nr:thioredoxin domain-containing protein [Falsochrobactrum shanghaiense]